MVMNRVRATSYVRRTLSQPMNKRRATAALAQHPDGSVIASGGILGSVAAPNRQLHLGLLADGSSNSRLRGLGTEPIEEETEGGVADARMDFSLKEDVARLKEICLTKTQLLLLFAPLGLWSRLGGLPTLCVFSFNFAALIPLSALLGAFTEELSLHTGEITGGLLNATFGNAVEMILSVQALRIGLLEVVKGTLLGSILSNLLLVLGMSFFAGGLHHYLQKFNEKGATCSVTLLLLSCMGIVIPTVAAVDNGQHGTYNILMISRITALLIGVTYCLFLFFQLYTHIGLFKDDDEDAEQWPMMSWEGATLMLFLVTSLVALHSELLVSSIEEVVADYGLSESFIGVILLPIVGNAAEHLTAVTVAMKNKVDLAMGVAVGSSAQIALFVFPFTVLVAWVMGQPLTMAVQPLSAVVMLLSVLVAMAVVQDGESNWLEGVMLMAAYLIISVVFWFDKPGPEGAVSPASSA
ncbi:manganese resistance 1 protein, putative [Eimeria necatrix]|uniref:Manganese resistance 1 protein, putative n=1 Tax=Eimeria necatrix TaxID=51315 RepID=U6N3D6_9EIME|nr:manganese resistance 1 protein, putative [Eimeria necatrix]CDJ69244.1 manganese resistance 1 protein, putative [Eimeria necatrix]